MRVAVNVGTDDDVTISSGGPQKNLPQRPRVDLSKIFKAVAAKTCASKLRSSGAGAGSDAC